MKRFLRFLIGVLVLGGLASGGFRYYTSRVATADSESGAGTYTQVVEVTRGSLSSSLSVVGSLDAVRSATLTFSEMSGTAKLLILDVTAGQAVSAGQVLATIDAAPYQQDLDEARSDLQAAEEALADLQAPTTALSLSQADVAVAAAEQRLAQARADVADLKALDLAGLVEAVRDAQDALDLLELESELAEHDTLAKSERDLTYAIAWHQLHIAQLEALVAENKANLEQMEDLAYDREQLGEAQSDLAHVQAQRELARQARAAELALAEAVLAEAEESLADAKAGGDALALAQAELAVREAEVALEAAQESRAALEEGPDPTDVAVAQALVDKRRLAVADAEAALAGTEMVAPYDGTVLEVYVRAGDAVGASTPVVTVADLKALQVVASVDETTIRQVSAGQAATISFDAYPGQVFTGVVLSVPLQGTLQGDVTVYEVPLSLEGAEALNLLVGMTANVEIEVGEATDALLVPAMALQKGSGGYQVLVPNTVDPAGEPELVPVQVGLSDGTYAQILKGLNAGDQVLVQLAVTDSNGVFQRNTGVFSGVFSFMGRR